MNCKNCGGSIRFEKGIGICEACGSRFEPEQAFENTEVFIAYIETDEQGRRTKDSLIAQDLYNKLENAKVHTFYERISASELADDALEQANYSALYRAGIVLLVGATPEHFETLLETYRSELEGKTLLPVYGGMNAYDLPQELQKLQAMNYEAIGASADLSQRILTLLGRETELDIIQVADQAQKKRRKILIVGIVAALLLLLIGFGAFLFFKTLPDLRQNQAYEEAITAYEEKRYADALQFFWGHADYKDGKNQLFKIFSQYNGYYKTKDEDLDLLLNIGNDFNATMTINFKKDTGKTATINETVLTDGTKIQFSYTDSDRQTGTATITFQNDGLTIKLPEFEKDIYLSLTDKTDQAVGNTSVSKDLLLSWLKETKTLKEIRDSGYELILEMTLPFPGYGVAPLFYNSYQYKIKNTDIQLLFGDVNENESANHDHLKITAICAPSTLLLPNKVGQIHDITFFSDDFLYTSRLSGSTFENYSPFIPSYGCWFLNNYDDSRGDHAWGTKTLAKTDRIILSTKEQIGADIWSMLHYEKTIYDQVKKNGAIKTLFVKSIRQSENRTLLMADFNDYIYCAIFEKNNSKMLWGAEILEITNNSDNLSLDLRDLYAKDPDRFQEFVDDLDLIIWPGLSNPLKEFEFVSVVSNPVEGDTMYVASEDVLNLRAEPSTESEIIAVMPIGQELTVLSIDGEWAEVQFEDKTGYCAAEYLSSTKPSEEP